MARNPSPTASLGSRLALQRLGLFDLILRRRLAPLRRGLHEQANDPGHGVTQPVTMDDHVDHAVLEQIFGALETVGKLFADGLLDDAQAGEAYKGAGPG